MKHLEPACGRNLRFWGPLLLASAPLFASQWGPVFPTHDFPTDRSFLLNSYFDYGTESSVFNSSGQKLPLNATLTRMRLVINPEYQPSRELSLGAFLNVDSLTEKGSGTQAAKSGLSDQYLFGEYRILDQRGASLGMATVFKIPAYAPPNEVNAGDNPFLLLGDGQIDGTIMGTSEYWIYNNIKLYGDLGLTYRSDGFASEVPFQIGADYVTPRYSFGLNFQGEMGLGNDTATTSDTSINIQTLTGNTNYVYAKNPTLLKFLMWGEYAFSYEWAIRGNFDTSIAGTNAPSFFDFAVGVSYRFFEPDRSRPRTAREVGIDTDDSSGVFEGELQEDSNKAPEGFDDSQ